MYNFKVGDFIERDGYDVNIGEIKSIMENGGLITEKYVFNPEESRIWEPKIGEYHWFFAGGSNYPKLGRMLSSEGRYGYRAEFEDDYEIITQLCWKAEPFIGTLPTIYRKYM